MLHTLRRHTSLVLCVAVLTVLAYATSLQSAGNSLTRVIHDAQTQTSVINITVAIDWDVDASPTPTIVIKGKAGTPLGRDYLSRIFEVAADTIYTMTEGRHRLGTVYVYSKSRKFENVDLHIENKPGHAKGNVSGLFVNGRDVGLYTTYWKEVEYGKYEEREDPSFSMGRTIGHEFGHYLYGLYDEYSGDSKYASDPQKGDADPNTIMSRHEEYANLSTSSDYGGTKTTAQYRVYKQKSAWETLISDPKNDGELADTRV